MFQIALILKQYNSDVLHFPPRSKEPTVFYISKESSGYALGFYMAVIILKIQNGNSRQHKMLDRWCPSAPNGVSSISFPVRDYMKTCVALQNAFSLHPPRAVPQWVNNTTSTFHTYDQAILCYITIVIVYNYCDHIVSMMNSCDSKKMTIVIDIAC